MVFGAPAWTGGTNHMQQSQQTDHDKIWNHIKDERTALLETAETHTIELRRTDDANRSRTVDPPARARQR
jgi:hypothetical protein